MPRPARLIALLSAAAAIGMLGACNIVGPLFVLAHGPEKAPAEYKLDREKKTVVFVDDRTNLVSRRSTRLKISAAAELQLAGQGVVKEVIRSQAIVSAASQDSHAEPKSIAELGIAVGADVVIYATVDFFGLSPDGATFQPTAQFRVKVIDTLTGERLWPESREGHPLLVQMNVRTEQYPQSSGELLEREAVLAEWSGERLAELFYEHVPPCESRVGRSSFRE
jgi:hypothetical protein